MKSFSQLAKFSCEESMRMRSHSFSFTFEARRLMSAKQKLSKSEISENLDVFEMWEKAALEYRVLPDHLSSCGLTSRMDFYI